MTLYIQNNETGKVMFQTTDFIVIPNEGECLKLNGYWYMVTERLFSFEKIGSTDNNSCTLFVRLYN